MKLDKDLQKLSKGVSSPYQSSRGPALGQAQVHTIQAIRNLQKKIIDLDKQNGKLNTRLFWLTVITAVVAVLQAIEIMKNI
ncbi:MAG: hypothetical protein HN981_04380 [Candidatus Pacebacteria bacterium]|jgi:hypothetical protein|nr:hypothetical protein [Candidatus Paceibacterota bacterium]MBT4652483.1 hypothetical protein [Candidatus Paceibacterota bacterium]MBT6756310.1 hypothetical protein [Candidatus Paceibacterota bacterium]MBT6921601.1 hypothetical protein [Candidatus Paceibacterota bacterium]